MKHEGYILQLFPRSKKMVNHFKVYWKRKDALQEANAITLDEARLKVIKVTVNLIKD